MSSAPVIADAAAESVAILDADNRVIRSGSAVLPIYSLTKTFIAATVIQSRIELTCRVSDWFDRHWVPRGADITVAQLLTHQSGIQDYFSASTAYSDAVAQQSTEASTVVWSDDTYADHTLRQPLWFEPGTAFAYSNPGYWLLGQILQKETDQSLAELIATHITDPLELGSVRLAEGIFAEDLPNYSAAWVWHGLLLASSTDVARFLASPLIDPLRTQLVEVAGKHASWQKPHYGYGLMIEPGKRYGHNGDGPGFSAACYKFARTGHTLCVLRRTQGLNAEAAEGSAMHQLLTLEGQLSGS